MRFVDFELNEMSKRGHPNEQLLLNAIFFDIGACPAISSSVKIGFNGFLLLVIDNHEYVFNKLESDFRN